MAKMNERQVFIVSIQQKLRQHRIFLKLQQDEATFTISPTELIKNKNLLEKIVRKDSEQAHFWAGIESQLKIHNKMVFEKTGR